MVAPVPRLPRVAPLSLAVVLTLGSGLTASEQQPQKTLGDSPAAARLSDADRAWLSEVEFLISEAEREAFLALRQDHRRRQFIQRFWEVRDPFPSSAVNEFHQEWLRRVELARDRFGGTGSDRGRAVLLAGPPTTVHRNLCPEILTHNEVWVYRDTGPLGVSLVFVLRPNRSDDPYKLWDPLDGIASLSSPSAARVPLGSDLRRALAGCSREREVQEIFSTAVDFKRFVAAGEWGPRPSSEWVASFQGRSTDLPEDVPLLGANLELHYPGRYQSRIVVQSLITIDKTTAGVHQSEEEGEAGGSPSQPDAASYNFLVDGEILRGEELFESFRYRFDLPHAAITGNRLPLVVQRHLRPGLYRQILRVRDLNGNRFFRDERHLEVPSLERVRTSTARTAAAEPVAATAAPVALPTDIDNAAALDGATRSLLRVAEPQPEPSDSTLKLLPLPDRMLTGRSRVDTRISGDDVVKVAFFLDGRRIMTKGRPPFSLELDFGESPRTHVLEAVGYDESGTEIARDRLPVNSGPHRFSVRLLEPLAGGRYAEGLKARAEVSVPRGETLDRVELFLNETLLATLYQPPFVQPVLLPTNQRITYVRAVAFLEDGNSAEDLVIINGPENLDHVEVDFVELYTSVVDRKGNNIEGLAAGDFTVLEDSTEQAIRRFERVVDLPIHAALILDASTSMEDDLEQAERAAMHFFERVIQPKDRAAVVVFNDQPELKVPLTNNHQVLAGGLAGMIAEGETALYDSVVFGLYYLSGLRGKRALILLTDGEDSSSKYSYNDALDFARQSGVAIYAIGLGIDNRTNQARGLLRHLAKATGGAYYSASAVGQLEGIYSKIEDELRAQYLIAYQSSQTAGDEFREVEVRVARRDLKAKTIPGYLP